MCGIDVSVKTAEKAEVEVSCSVKKWNYKYGSQTQIVNWGPNYNIKEQMGLSRDCSELESFLCGAANSQLHSTVAMLECGSNVAKHSDLSRDTKNVDS